MNNDNEQDIETASADAEMWNGSPLYPFSWEHEVVFDQHCRRGSALYNAQLMLWIMTTPPAQIEAMQENPDLIKKMVKEFAQANGLRIGSAKMKLANTICTRVMDKIQASETEPVIEDSGGAPGPK